MWQKIECQWLASYELLYIAAYRLIGKRYADEGGMVADLAGAALTRRQRLFCLLFPLLATLGLMVILAAFWLYTYIHLFPHITPHTYYMAAPLWHVALQLLLIILPIFAAPAYFDLRRAIRLLIESAHQPNRR